MMGRGQVVRQMILDHPIVGSNPTAPAKKKQKSSSSFASFCYSRLMKSLKFQPQLAEQIRQGTKTSTWRLFDDKNLQPNDVVDLLENGVEKPFALARITQMSVKTLGSLEENDFIGHERYASEEEMYANYRKYYGPEVGPDTIVKILWFELIEEITK